LASSAGTSKPSKPWVGKRCANSDARGPTTEAVPAANGPALLTRAPEIAPGSPASRLSNEQRSHGDDVISGSTTSLTTSVTEVSMYWTVVMTSETGVADAATGATTTGFDGAAVAALDAVLVVGSTGFDSGAAAFAAGAAGSVVAAGEFVFVSDADEFVTAAVALESEPVPFAADVTGSVVAGSASATVVAVTIAGGTAVAVDVTGSGADAGTSGAEAGTSDADAVTLVADTASVEPEVTVPLEAAGSDCVAATADSLLASPGRTTFVAVIDGRAAVDCGWGAAPKPCGVPPAGATAPALDPPLLLSADGLSWPWASAPLAPESAAAITPPLLPTRRPADSKQTTAAKRRCM
jgi:hypothetical protein